MRIGNLPHEFVYALLFCGSFGTICIVAGIKLVFSPFWYRLKKQGKYVDVVSTRGRGAVKYNLVCQYEYDGNLQKGVPVEGYSGKELNKYFKPGENMDIYVNVKKPESFRRKRFYGFAGGIIWILFGLLMLCVPVQVWQLVH